MTNEKLPEEFPQDLVQAAKEAATFNGKPVATLKTGGLVPDAPAVDPNRTTQPVHPALSNAPESVVTKEQNQRVNQAAAKTPLPLGDDGGVMPQNLEQMWTIANHLAKSGMVPRQYADNPGAVLATMQLAIERGLKPMSALQNMANVHGRVTGYSEQPLGEVYRAGIVESFREYWVDHEGKEISQLDFKAKPFAAVCEIKVRDRGLVQRVFTLDDAKQAGLLTNNTKLEAAWVKYTKRMLQMRARGWALKDGAPDVIAGLPMPEYDEPGDEPGLLPPPATLSAKEKLSNANRSQATADGEVTAVPGVQGSANGSVPRANVQGDPGGQPGQHDPDVSQAPRSATSAGVVQVPAKAPVRSPRSRSPRVDNRAAPVPS